MTEKFENVKRKECLMLRWKMKSSSINVNYMIHLASYIYYFFVVYSPFYHHKRRVPEVELRGRKCLR